MAWQMTTSNRWAAVAALVLVVVSVPVAVRAIPAHDVDISASALLTKVRDSGSASWSGYIESTGTLQLPVTEGDFTGLSSLLGEQTDLRAWWRSADDWRVDRLSTTGEDDLFHGRSTQLADPTQVVTAEWSFEKNAATIDADPQIRLPRTSDLVPPVLGRRVVDGVSAADVRRLGARRVAGRSAVGLRVTPPEPQASVDHVDLWVDPASGVPLLVEGFDSASGDPVFTSRFRSFSSSRPASRTTRFDPPAGSKVSFDGTLDIADTANQYAPLIAPPTFGGLPKAKSADRAVGVYGTGITQVITIPLRGREAGPLRDQLKLSPGATLVDAGVVVQDGPLSLMLTGEGHDSGFLVAGTVTTETLLAGAVDLAERTRYVGFR